MWKIGSKCARFQVASSLLASLHLTLFLAAERKITPEVSPTKSCTWMVASISLTELLCGPDYYSSSGCHLQQHSRTELVMGSFGLSQPPPCRFPEVRLVFEYRRHFYPAAYMSRQLPPTRCGCVYVSTTSVLGPWVSHCGGRVIVFEYYEYELLTLYAPLVLCLFVVTSNVLD